MILQFLDGRDHCELFHSCSGHFNKEGDRLIAKLVYERLLKEKFALLTQ